MVLIDFEKAFDTLELQFLHNTLKYLNFGPNLRNWISVMYSDAESGTLNGGYKLRYPEVSGKHVPWDQFFCLRTTEAKATDY